MLKLPETFLFIFLLFSAINVFSQNSFHVTGKINGATGHKFYLFNIYGGLHNNSNVNPIDSLISQADTFSFRGKFNEAQFYSLSMDTSKWFVPFIIDTGKILILGSADSFPSFRIRESWENEKLKLFGVNTNPLIYKMNEAAANENMKQYDSLLNTYFDSILVYTTRYPNSYGIFSKGYNFLGDDTRFKPFGKRWFPLVSDKLKNTAEGKQIAYMLYTYNIDSIKGNAFPNIETYDTAKRKTTFSLNPQNIYLIDYWASWCVPCVQKLPSLKKLYYDYKYKGFKIVSLSIDLNYEAWLNAIKKHEILWENYSSLIGTNAVDVKYFNIHAIPYTILVGKNNKIIKINPTEEEVEAYLKKQ
jgi:thiol-disulfide isomerase/thioredoxin